MTRSSEGLPASAREDKLIGQTPGLVAHADDREGSDHRRWLLVSGELNAYVVEKRFIRPDQREVIGLVSASASRRKTWNASSSGSSGSKPGLPAG